MKLAEQYKLLTEENINSLVTKFQKEFFNSYTEGGYDLKYSDLPDYQKKYLDEYIEKRKKEVADQVDSITNNTTYQSWIYKMLKNYKIIFPEDIDKTKNVIIDYEKVKRSEKFPKEYKDILSFKSFSDLYKIVKEFSKELSSGDRVLDFGKNEIVYNERGIKIVKLMKFSDCDYLTKDTGWCIQQEQYFNYYKPPFYMIVQNDKKIALLHLESNQFKDVHDEPIKEMDKNLTNVMLNFLYNQKIKISDLEGDLSFIKTKYINSELFYKFFVKDLVTDGIYKGDIIIVNLGLTKLPEWLSYIRVVDGDFKCYNNKLTDLEYVPEIINGVFDIHGNIIEDFQYSPIEIRGDYFDCSSNALSSLNGFPKLNSGVTINLNNNLLKGLLGGLPNTAFYFSCSQNYLRSLEGSPTKITINYDCSDNKLHSLKYAPVEIGGGFNCEQNYLENLDYIPVISAYSATETQSISNYRVQQQLNNRKDFSNQEIRDAIEKSIERNKPTNESISIYENILKDSYEF